VGAPASGLSVDNRAPAAPQGFTGTWSPGPGVQLSWQPNTEPNLGGYLLHRGTTPDFVPTSATLVATPGAGATTYEDPASPPALFYKLAAISLYGDVSPYVLAQAGTPLAVGPDAPAFALAGAGANPAHGGRLGVSFALPDAGPARLTLVDVAGRRVAEREVGALGAGRHIVGLGDASVPAGLYFVRLEQGTRVKTIRVTVLD